MKSRRFNPLSQLTMNDLIHRFHSAETDFLDALESGTHTLASCNQTWSILLDDVSTGLLTGSIHSETLSLAHSVASRVSYLARWYLDIKLEVENISTQLHDDCDAMLRQMKALSLNDNAEPTSLPRDGRSSKAHRSTTSTVPNVESSSASFIPSAYEWLLDNLHNPYPTAEVKAQLAAASSYPVSSVNSWFINARRRIGWTTLCRENFSCRADMTDAAYRALVEEDPQRMLAPELRHSFVAMKVAAESIYPPTFTRDVFVDSVVKDTMDKHEESIEVVECYPVEQVDLGKTTEGPYPSPAQSVVGSPVPALNGSLMDESEGDVVPPTLAGSKRHWSSIEPENQLPPDASRPIKRLRASRAPQAHLPSPSSSTDGTELLSDASSPSVSPERLTQSEINKAPPSPKQCVSDIDYSGMPNRSGDLTTVQHIHTILDSLPCPNAGNESINDWFDPDLDALFAIPPPVDATEPNFSTSWEVELFKNYCIPENSKHTPKSLPITDTDISAATHLSEFDTLLQSITNDTYFAPSDGILSSNITMDPHTAFSDPSTPDISHIDWTSLLDGSDAYQSIDSTFSQYSAVSQPLPDIDLSILQLPPLMPTAQARGDLASKRAKLDQLHAMQEAVRRMEQELQSQGIML